MSKKEIISTAKVLLVNEQYPGHILVLQREKGMDLPGGKIKPGEPLEEGLRREVREEIGDSELQDIHYLSRQSKRLGKNAVRAFHVFVAHVDVPEDGFQLSEEHSDYHWTPIEDFEQIDISKRYKDAVKLGELVLRGLSQQVTAPELVPA